MTGAGASIYNIGAGTITGPPPFARRRRTLTGVGR
jgi:hypothetical protein